MSQEKSFGPVVFLPGANAGNYPNSNSVYVEGAGILVDAGADGRRYRELRAGPGIDELWLSHWHEDHLSHIFQAGEIIELGACSVEIIHTPGHTPGHLAFFFREPGVLFMGDYDLTRFGPWYGDRDSSIDDVIASMERLRRVEARVWLTSHGEGCFESPPGELFDRYLAVIDEREGKLLDFLGGGPRSMDDIAAQHIVYRKPREPRAFFDWGERALMGKHLDRLLRAGRVANDEGRYRLLD